MPIHTLRETIVGECFVPDEPEGIAYFTKRINLPEGMKNEVLSIDVINENVCPFIPDGTRLTAVQVYLSPYPIQFTQNTIQPSTAFELTTVGPYASDSSIIYKSTELTTLDDFNEQPSTKIWRNQFPNDALGSVETTTFYSPHLYLTVLVFNEPNTTVPIKYSVYAKIKQSKCSSITSAMGCHGEFLEAQSKRLTSTAVFTNPIFTLGQTFPMWRYGGIRPEFMIQGATALRYFNRVASNQSQAMISRNEFQTAFKEATTMAQYDKAFGDQVIPLPDWIQILDVGGITSGVIRPFPPPLKFADNGNTLMF